MLGACQLVTGPSATQTTLRRVGFLHGGVRTVQQPYTDAFVDQLRQLGWVEDQNLTIDWRFAESHNELLPDLAGELVRIPVDVLAAWGSLTIVPAQQQTSSIPIVMMGALDPNNSATGSVQSLAKPGSNLTGNTFGISTVGIKSVELLRTVEPHLSRLAILVDRSSPAYKAMVPFCVQAAQALGVQVSDLDVRSVADSERAFEAVQAGGIDGLILVGTTTNDAGVNVRVPALAAARSLPVIYTTTLVVTEYGGLMAFSPNLFTLARQGAEYVDKILRGARPADLPVQEPRQFDFVVNVKTAQQLGITFPPDAAAQVTQWVQQ
jgi:putative ABC transport system substrate-binding protein